MGYIVGTFAADGSVDIPTASAVTILIGSQTAEAFGGGTVEWQVSHDNVNFTTAHTFTGMEAKTTVDFVSGVTGKLVLAGATAPNLFYSIKYE